MKYFKTGGYKELIEEVDVYRETDNFVIFKNNNGKERRDAKLSNYANYFKTKKEAYDFILNKAVKNKEHFERGLSSSVQKLNDILLIGKEFE